MSDYSPNPRNPDPDRRNLDPDRRDLDPDRRNLDGTEPNRNRGVSLIAGILVALAVIVGLMFFAGRNGDRTNEAQVPDRNLTQPADQPRTPAIPPVAPAPANPAPAQPRQ